MMIAIVKVIALQRQRRRLLHLLLLPLAMLLSTTAAVPAAAAAISSHSSSSPISARSFGNSVRSSSSSSSRRRRPRFASNRSARDDGLSFLQHKREEGDSMIRTVQNCNAPLRTAIVRGALLRIASDLTGGTVLEGIKTRTTTGTETPLQAARNIVAEGGGSVLALWRGTPSRTAEGTLIGAAFMAGSVLTKAQLKRMGASPTAAALAGGLVGGLAQAVVMTPAGLVFTALNGKSDSAAPASAVGGGKKSKRRNYPTPTPVAAGAGKTTIGVIRAVLRERGVAGFYAGGGAMCLRQATNWASRAGVTELARTVLHLSKCGVAGELASGVLGGIVSCWNTPIETIRVLTQLDVAQGRQPQSMVHYWTAVVDRDGYAGLFRGVTPRALQAIWQTTFLVVVPNLMGI
jgi:Mitochondrial carrier protein